MRNYWCLFFVLSLPAESFREEKKAEKVVGTLKDSVTFHLKMSEPFDSIFWLQMTSNDFSSIAVVEGNQICHVKVLLSKFKRRLNASGDCTNLQITNLHQDDSGEYKAQIQDRNEYFKLEVYKNLSESDLEVRCENLTLGAGNYTWQLNCSAEKWGDGANYSWTSMSKDGKIPSQIVQSPFQDSDVNYTCTAENPVSSASKTVSVKEICKGNSSGEVLSKQKLIPVWIVLGTVVIAAAAVIGCVLWKKQKKAAHIMPPDPAGCTVPDESSKTIYAQIDCLPSETQKTGAKKKRQQKRPKAQDGPHTVYASVGQPKPADDSSIKTVYDTVNAPRPPEGSEFHKLL